MLKLSAYNKQTYNISSEVPKSTNAVFDEFGTGEAIYAPARGFDVGFSVLCNSKAKDAGLL